MTQAGGAAIRACIEYCYWATNDGDEATRPPLTQFDPIDANETLAALLAPPALSLDTGAIDGLLNALEDGEHPRLADTLSARAQLTALRARVKGLEQAVEKARGVELFFFDRGEFEHAGRIHQALAALRSPGEEGK